MDLQEKISKAKELISNANYIIALTGAGISTPSGIPDFRTPGKGLWSKVDPEEVATIWAFKSNPRKVLEFLEPMVSDIFNAKPNRAHIALAKLEEIGKLKAVITQNIDGLHQKAGSKNVIEVHGNIREAVCLSCGKPTSIDVFREKVKAILNGSIAYPECSNCGGFIKPNVVFFGEPLPKEALFSSYAEAQKSDLLLVVGSSLVVQPICMLPQYAYNCGAKIIVINLTSTYIDEDAEVVINDEVDKILPQLIPFD